MSLFLLTVTGSVWRTNEDREKVKPAERSVCARGEHRGRTPSPGVLTTRQGLLMGRNPRKHSIALDFQVFLLSGS